MTLCAISRLPRAASVTFREISEVVAVCCSTALAIVLAMTIIEYTPKSSLDSAAVRIGSSSSTAADINFRGDIVGVGSYYAGSSSNARALVAFAGGVFEDLNPYVTNRGSVFLLDALKINDLGYILATAIVNGEGRYYLLVPAMEECLMNWAEKTYPDLFKPAGPRTVVAAPYKYRYYQQSRSYVGVSTADAHAYYMLADGVLRDAGSIADFAVRTGCSG